MKYRNWLNEWLETIVRPAVKERTYLKYEAQARLHIVPFLGDCEINHIQPRLLQKFIAFLSAKYAPNTVTAILSVVKNSLKKAVSSGVARKEFTSCVSPPKQREREAECFTLKEQQKIQSAVLKAKDSKLFGIVLCLYTGLRIGELLALTWEDIDLGKSTLTVSKTCMDSWENGRYVKLTQSPKTSSSYRVIPLPKQLVSKVTQLKKACDGEYVVCGRSSYGAQVRSYQKTFARLLRRLGIPHRKFHSLRHTFATRALECGMDVKTLSEILGHKNPTVTLCRYAHSMLDYKSDMMNKIGRLFV